MLAKPDDRGAKRSGVDGRGERERAAEEEVASDARRIGGGRRSGERVRERETERERRESALARAAVAVAAAPSLGRPSVL